MIRSLVPRFSLLLSFLLIAQTTMAQDTVEMADQLRADGKIWVVVAVIAAVFFGIIVYLVRLDSKIGKLEREVKNSQLNAGKSTTNMSR
ncbi:CcmD family protein [Fibrella aquatica]|uniref:CcmD family protein n=1 Tax=Fibrella aquatica TaxID=3242487 RepID=UPI0035209868